MGILERIKKRQLDGFKEFVQNMETTGAPMRQQIFLNGVLEDPLFMAWVTKNLKNFKDVLDLPTDDIFKILNHHREMVGMFAKSLADLPADQFKTLESIVPHHFSKIKDELAYMTAPSAGEKEGSVFFILKSVRKLQDEAKIEGFQWNLPSMEIFQSKKYPDGDLHIYFENGLTAAQGQIFKGKRTGSWKHYYDNGKILAEGEYLEGLKKGSWSFYYSSGLAKSQGEYLLDLRDGPWKEWDRAGLESVFEFKEGVKKDQSSSN